MPAQFSKRLSLVAIIGAVLLALHFAGPSPAQAQSGILTIITDRTQYLVGDSIHVCYTVAAPGPITITDTQADGTSHVLLSGVDDGTGGCVDGTITPPLGRECPQISEVGGTIGGGLNQTCFQVVSQLGPPSPGPCIAIYPPPPGCGGGSGASITTDQTQYNVGDTAQICYAVPGPGPFTITDLQADGTSNTLISAYDDGTGGCFSGTVTPPAGTECLQLNSSGGSGGSAQTCFQVAGPTPLPQPGSQDCGSVSVLGGHVTSAGAQQVENCFYQAYQQCSPATMVASLSGVDAGTRHSFSLSNGCVISDSAQNFVAPRPPGPATVVTCAGLSNTGSGLLFSSCGSYGDVFVPAS